MRGPAEPNSLGGACEELATHRALSRVAVAREMLERCARLLHLAH